MEIKKHFPWQNEPEKLFPTSFPSEINSCGKSTSGLIEDVKLMIQASQFEVAYVVFRVEPPSTEMTGTPSMAAT
jgi:hypothetical protein